MKNRFFANLLTTDTLKALAAFSFVAVFVLLGIYRVQPPRAVPASAPLTEFSSERAMNHLETIARKPHPPGSPEHARVLEYILSEFAAIGLDPEVQEAVSTLDTHYLPRPSGLVAVAEVKNIVAKLKGSDGGKAILVAGHYDSIVPSLNASDGGVSVAVALELARALQAGPPLKNDVIFLLTDFEEVDLLGSKAFVKQHPWIKDIGLVLHFIARGSSGPSIMFETSPENGWLIEEFAKTTPHPIANSLAYEVYQLLPNDTDFTRYKNAGLPGFNFAHIDSSANYHTMLDSPENLDERTLQHHGSQALALTRHFGNLDLKNIKKDNAVYFDILGLTMVHYPTTWVTPLMLIVTLLYTAVIVLGLRKRLLTFLGIVAGTLAFVLTLVVVFVFITLLEGAILAAHSEYRLMFMNNLYNGHFYLVSFVALAVAATSLLYIFFHKKIRVQNMAVGGLSVWLIMMWISGVNLPGTSYLLMWPLTFGLLAFGFAIISKSQEFISWQHLAVSSLGAIPGLILVVPTTYLIHIALPPLAMGGWLPAIIIVLLIGLLVLHLSLIIKSKAWLLPTAATIVGVSFIILGSLTSSYNAERPKRVSISYGLHVDPGASDPIFWKGTGESGEAFWISNRSPDKWSSQFFPNGANQDYDPFDFFNPFDPGFFLGPAPVANVPVPQVEVLDDTIDKGVRRLRLGISFPQTARMIGGYVSIEPGTIQSAKLDGLEDIEVRPEDESIAFNKYPYSQERLELVLDTTSSQPIKTLIFAVVDGLPTIPDQSFSPRPNDIIPSPSDQIAQDSTIIQKAFQFPMP